MQLEGQLRRGRWKPLPLISFSLDVCAEEPTSVVKTQQSDQLAQNSLAELHDESKIYSVKLQESKGLKVRLEIQREKII